MTIRKADYAPPVIATLIHCTTETPTPTVRARRLDMKRNEKADRDPGGQDRGQGYLHRGFPVLPSDFLVHVLDLNPHTTLLDLLSETTAYRPPAIDRASNQGR